MLQGLLWLLMGSVLAGSNVWGAKTFPRYRQLIEQQDESTPANEDLEEEYAERRILAEQYYRKSPCAARNALLGVPVYCGVFSNSNSTEQLSTPIHGHVSTQPPVGPYPASRPSRSTGKSHLGSHAPSAGLAAKMARPPPQALSSVQPKGCPDQANGPNCVCPFPVQAGKTGPQAKDTWQK